MKPGLLASSFFALLPALASAEPPKLVADIPPVQGLAQMVMGDLGDVALLLEPGTSPHHITLKPSHARAMADADLVVWVGPELSPHLGEALENLAPDAAKLVLSEQDGLVELNFRDLEDLGGEHGDHDEHEDHHDHAEHDDHDEDHADHGDHDDHEDHGSDDDHGHEDHEDHDDHAEDHADHEDHEDHDDHDDHAEDHADHEDHDDHDDHAGHDDHDHAHDGLDPHMWLSPDNARVWLSMMAAELSKMDPENAETYRSNARNAAAEVAQAEEKAREILIPMTSKPLAVYHDAFQYYEVSFGLTVVGAWSDSDAVAAGPAHLDRLRDQFEENQPACILAEPGSNLKLLRAVAPDLPDAELDPLGRDLTSGATHYPALIVDLAERIARCGNDG